MRTNLSAYSDSVDGTFCGFSTTINNLAPLTPSTVGENTRGARAPLALPPRQKPGATRAASSSRQPECESDLAPTPRIGSAQSSSATTVAIGRSSARSHLPVPRASKSSWVSVPGVIHSPKPPRQRNTLSVLETRPMAVFVDDGSLLPSNKSSTATDSHGSYKLAHPAAFVGTVLGGAHRRIRIPLFELRVLAQRQADEVIDRGWIPLAGSGTKSPPSFLSKQRRTPSGKLFKFPEGVLSIPSFFVTAIEPLAIIYCGHAHPARQRTLIFPLDPW